MRICIISPVNRKNFGGIEELINQEIQLFRNHGHEVWNLEISKSESLNENEYELKFTNVFSALKYFKSNVFGPFEIVHFHDPRGILFLTLSAYFKSSILLLSLHGSIFHKRESFLRRIYFNSVIIRNIKKSNWVIEPGFKMFGYAKKYNANSLLALPLNFNKIEYHKENRVQDSFLCHGRFSNLKDQKSTIQTIEYLRMITKKNIQLYLTGSTANTEYFKEIKKISGEKKWIKLYPDCSDEELFNFHRKLKYFISYSRYEGFGIAQADAVSKGMYAFLTPYQGSKQLFGNTITYLRRDVKKDALEIKKIMNLTDLQHKKTLKRAHNNLLKFQYQNWVGQLEKYQRNFEQTII